MTKVKITPAVLRELLDYNPDTGVFVWKTRDRKWFKSEKDWRFWNKKYPGEIYNLDYEKLVDDPEIEIRNILNFCNLDWDENCLQHQKNKKIVATASLAQVRSPVYKSSIKKWQNFKDDLVELEKIIEKKN